MRKAFLIGIGFAVGIAVLVYTGVIRLNPTGLPGNPGIQKTK